MICYVQVFVFKANAAPAQPPPADGLRIALRRYSHRFSGVEHLLVTRRRRTPDELRYSHDAYDTVDLTFDQRACEVLNAMHFSDPGWRLTELILRFVDYGCFNVIASFESTVASEFAAESVSRLPVYNTDVVLGLLAELDEHGDGRASLFRLLWERSLIQPTSLAIPGTSMDLLNSADFQWGNSYLYSQHIFLLKEPAEIVRTFTHHGDAEHRGITFENIGVEAFFPEDIVIWIGHRAVTAEEKLYLVEADTLCLAEQTMYSIGNLAYQELLQLFVTSPTVGSSSDAKTATQSVINRIKRRFRRSELTSILPSTQHLRRILVRDRLALSKVISRPQELDSAQLLYYLAYRQSDPPDRLSQDFRETEQLLKYVVEGQEAVERERADYAVELILLSLTLLTLFSVFNDVEDFWTRAAEWRLPKIAVTLLVLIIVTGLALIFRGVRRRRHVHY